MICFCDIFLFIPDIVLSTAHKAKGLEFDTVQLTEDYSCIELFLLSGKSV